MKLPVQLLAKSEAEFAKSPDEIEGIQAHLDASRGELSFYAFR